MGVTSVLSDNSGGLNDMLKGASYEGAMGKSMKEYDKKIAPIVKDEEKQKADLESYKKKESEAKFEPPKAPEPPPVTPFNQFGSAASYLAVFGGLLTKRPLTNSLNAAAGVMSAANANDAKQFKQKFEKWQADTKYALDMAEFELNKLKEMSGITQDILHVDENQIGNAAKAMHWDEMFKLSQMRLANQELKNREKQLSTGKEIDQWMNKYVQDKLAGNTSAVDDDTKHLKAFQDALQFKGDITKGDKSQDVKDTEIIAQHHVDEENEKRKKEGKPPLAEWEEAEVRKQSKGSSRLEDKGKAGKLSDEQVAEKSDQLVKEMGYDKAFATMVARTGDKAMPTLTKDDATPWAELYLKQGSSALAGMGRGDKATANLALIHHIAARIMKDRKLTPDQIMKMHADFKGMQAEATAIGRRAGTTEVGVGEFDNLIEPTRDSIHKLNMGQFKDYNSFVAAYDSHINDPDYIEAFDNIQELQNAYTAVLVRGGQRSDAAQELSQHTINTLFGVKGSDRALDTMKANTQRIMKGIKEAKAGTVGAPPKDAVDHLKKNPTLKDAFDEKYGAGEADKVLGGQ